MKNWTVEEVKRNHLTSLNFHTLFFLRTVGAVGEEKLGAELA
jgi:hypothetical protein